MIEAMKQARSLLLAYQNMGDFRIANDCLSTVHALTKAIEQAEKQQALDKKADNARELGLDYEPTHTDHPMRHWDRTCPACVAEDQEPVCDKDPHLCWSVRCQLGKVCKNTSPPKRDMSTKQENVYTSAERVHEIDKSIHEPKAWIYNGNLHIFDPTDWAIEPESVQPLYTAPLKREWVGLTELEIKHYNSRLSGSGVAQEIEAKLRERNI